MQPLSVIAKLAFRLQSLHVAETYPTCLVRCLRPPKYTLPRQEFRQTVLIRTQCQEERQVHLESDSEALVLCMSCQPGFADFEYCNARLDRITH